MKDACEISTIDDDWIQKGFHVRVLGEELEIYTPDGQAVEFASAFNPAMRNRNTVKLTKAVKILRQECLSDPDTRALWIREAGRAIGHLRGYRGHLFDRAQQRVTELESLITSLHNYDVAQGRE